MKHFTCLGYRRWTKEEEETLKDIFIEGRENSIPHKQLWEDIAEELDRKPSEVKKKINRMYQTDEELKEYKRNSWTKEKIIEQLKDLYLNNEPMHKSALPNHLCFTILKVTGSSPRSWFQSVDHAIAEAIYQVGHPRLEDGSLDECNTFSSFDEVLSYIRHGLKKRHVWTLEEVQTVLKALHEADFPLTIPFLTNHYNIYKDVIGVNRKLESFKDVIKKFMNDGQIESFPQLICTIAPEYENYYNKDRSRLKLSTEEIRVKKFLDRFDIPYKIPRLGQKVETNIPGYSHFVPDFVIFSDKKFDTPIAVVEVFGSISDRDNADVGVLYKDKTEAKRKFWNSLEGIDFIEIYNTVDRCDLDDRSLFNLLGCYIDYSDQNDLQDLIATNSSEFNRNIQKFGIGILYNKDKSNYLVSTGGLNFELDKLFDLPKLTSKDPAMKKLLDFIHRKEQDKRPQSTRSDNTMDYEPPKKDPYYDHNRWIAPNQNVVHRSI